MNWVDLIIIIIFGVYVWDGFRRGFIKLSWELLGLVIAFIFALKFYTNLADFLTAKLHFSIVYSRPISFLVIWFLTQLVFYFVGRLLAYYTPMTIRQSQANHYLGIIPAVLKAILLIIILIILFLMTPIGHTAKNAITSSLIGRTLITKIAGLNVQIEKIFTSQPITSQTQISNGEAEALSFRTTQMEIKEIDEDKMVAMLNAERAKVGAPSVRQDPLMRNVARAHSRDMLIKGYFSHYSPDGQGVIDRFSAAKVDFNEVGENLALSPSVELANVGLINSPEHKKNILNPNFTRIGLGIMDTGQYGLMITQNFAN